jgi:hypothetical protein
METIASQVEARVKGRYLVLDLKTRQLSLTQEGMLVIFRWGRADS